MAGITVAGKKVGKTGFGLMGLTWRPTPTAYDEAAKVMNTALEHDANLWNAAQFYGPPNANSLQLLKDYFGRHPERAKEICVSMKGCFSGMPPAPDGTVEGVKQSIDGCLAALEGSLCFIDVFAPARVDPSTPIETTVGAIAEYVRAGKIGGVGLSEVNADTIRKAHAVHPISVVEVEFSLFSTDLLTNGVGAACKELGIPILAYSPLSRGFLTGQLRKHEDIPEGDFRRMLPRFQPDVFDQNLRLVDAVEKIAKKKNCTTPQVAIAWVRAQSGRNGMGTIIPIPGATKQERVRENMADIALSEDELKEIQSYLDSMPVSGDRYGGPLAKLMNL